MKSLITLTIAWLISCSVGFAGTLTAELDKQQTTLDEPFWLTISIQGSLDGTLTVPETQDFEFVKTGESTNISIVNGSVTKELQYTYQVRALRQGSYSIPSFVAKIDGREEKTLPIAVQVVATGQQQKGGLKSDAKNLVFVERDIPKITLYEGQAIKSTGRLLTRTRLTEATPVRDPSPAWRVIPVDKQRNRNVTRDGLNYDAVEMDEVLIPLKAGKLSVPQFCINASWIEERRRGERGRPNSVFDLFNHGMFNLGEAVSRKLASEDVQLEIKPLPAPKPATFSDIVGAFSLKAAVSSRDIAVGETVTVTVELSGQGALDRMTEVKMAVPGARIYDDKPSLVEKVEPGAGLVSTKRFKFAVVPTHPGSLNLGDVKLTAFNPFTERYEELSSSLGAITVKGNAPSSNSGQQFEGPTTPAAKESPANTTSDVEPLSPKRLDPDSIGVNRWWLSPWVLAIEVFIVMLIASWFLFRKFIWPSQRVRSKMSDIKPRCDALREDLRKGDMRVVLSTLTLVRDVLVMPGKDVKAMTSSELISCAKNNDMNQTALESLIRVLEIGDRLQYGLSEQITLSEQLVTDINRLIELCLTKVSNG